MFPSKTVKKGVAEFFEQSSIVANAYHGSRLKWLLSMFYCLLRYGARPIDYVRFEFHKKSATERGRYLTFYKYFRLLNKFGHSEKSVNGKIAEYQTFRNYIHRNWMVVGAQTPKESVLNFVAVEKEVFAKPNFGDQGHGILRITNGEQAKVDDLLALSSKSPFVLEGRIVNDDRIAQLNPTSLNTVRAYTLILNDGSVEILAMMLRVGKVGAFVDNWGSGGVGYNIDLDSGVVVDYGLDKLNHPYIFHPGSGVQMIGFQLPEFERLKSLVIELSKIVPKARFVGWDLAITTSGYELVEMNCPGGHDFLQAFGMPFGDLLKKELT